MVQAHRHPNVVNVAEVEGRTMTIGTKFGMTMKHLGLATGSRGIGCTLYELEPGRSAFPFHFHCGNEESIYILEGEGTLRIGEQSVPVRVGDYATFPIGPKTAHQLRNTGTTVLRYLCFSTMSTAEVVGYPDSKKIGALAAESRDAAMRGDAWIRMVAFESSAAGYYDGEEVE